MRCAEVHEMLSLSKKRHIIFYKPLYIYSLNYIWIWIKIANVQLTNGIISSWIWLTARLGKTATIKRSPDTSRHHGGPFQCPFNPLKHHGTMVPRGLRGALNVSTIVPRAVSFWSDFSESGFTLRLSKQGMIHFTPGLSSRGVQELHAIVWGVVLCSYKYYKYLYKCGYIFITYEYLCICMYIFNIYICITYIYIDKLYSLIWINVTSYINNVVKYNGSICIC